MQATLTVVRFHDVEPKHPISVSFGTEGGSLGRGKRNQLVLPDPKRWVSSEHARIQWQDDGFVLIDQSRNGTFLHSLRHRSSGKPAQRLERGKAVALSPGDEVVVGHYGLRFDVEADAANGGQAVRRRRRAKTPRGRDSMDSPTQLINFDDEAAPELFRLQAKASSGKPVAKRRPSVAKPSLKAAPSPSAAPRATSQGPHAERSVDLAETFLKAVGLESREALPIPATELMNTAANVLRRLTGGVIEALSRQQRTRKQLGLPAGGRDGQLGPDRKLEDSLALLLMNPELGPAAADGAVAQLHRHEEAMLAAVRLGVVAQIDRLDPARFMTRNSASIGNLVAPWSAETRAWRRFVQAHDRIRAQLQANPDAALGSSFADAYRRALAESSRDGQPGKDTDEPSGGAAEAGAAR